MPYVKKTKPALWVAMCGAKTAIKKPKRIARESAARRKLNAEYRREVKSYLAVQALCMSAIPLADGCLAYASQVHHIRGRAGKLLLNRRYWMAVCDHCHKWIHAHPKKAAELGMLASKGEWGKQS